MSARPSLRNRALLGVTGLLLVSVTASVLSLIQVQQAERQLDTVNRVFVPLHRHLAQLRADTDLLKREIERRQSSQHWGDPHWRPQPLPSWVQKAIDADLKEMSEILGRASGMPLTQELVRWNEWRAKLGERWSALRTQSDAFLELIRESRTEDSFGLWTQMTGHIDEWSRDVTWGTQEAERTIRAYFSQTENKMGNLRTSLQAVLLIVVALSVLLFWFADRALQPLAHLTAWVKTINNRGLRREDRLGAPGLESLRDDEVGELAREFRRMTNEILEREKTVESQTQRLQEQNQELKSALEELRIAEPLAAVGRMSAQVAHEVRNPLHSIGLETELAIERAENLHDSTLRSNLLRIQGSVERLEKITGNYLRLSKPVSECKERVGVGDWVESALSLYANAIEAHQIQVEWKIAEDVAAAAVDADRLLLEQALGNLLHNSIQLLAEQPAGHPRRLLVSADRVGTQVRVSVEDSGPGVSDEFRSKLFVPFSTSRPQGTGLGLSFVKRVIEDHSGRVAWTGAGSLGGARFEIQLSPSGDASGVMK